jgi:hypothetical protein
MIQIRAAGAGGFLLWCMAVAEPEYNRLYAHPFDWHWTIPENASRVCQAQP